MALGLLAAGVALGVGELVAVVTGPTSAPLTAVGQGFVRITPEWLKEFATSTFYVYDKLALEVGMVLVLALFARAVGVVAYRWLTVGMIGVGVFGLVGVVAAMTAPDASQLDIAPSAIGAAAGAIVLRMLVPRLVELAEPEFDVEQARTNVRMMLKMRDRRFDEDRRRFLYAAARRASLGVAVVGGGLGGVLLNTRGDVSKDIATLKLPMPASKAPRLPDGVDLNIPGLASFTTPNPSFYRIDTALVTPRVDPATWELRIHGMVDRELKISFAELLKRPMIERDITLTCVSNEVGGNLIGEAKWLGAPLADLLKEAGVHPGADQVFTTSADGWTCGTPLEAVMTTPNAMLAVGMNGDPLPVAHGFPVRMIVPGLYGYVSGTKWIVDMELTTFAAGPQAYWIQREWAPAAPIKTMCRIDVPPANDELQLGQSVKVAGVAWAQNRGISMVEVRLGEQGEWQPARLAPVPNNQTWRQWVWDWTPGARGQQTLWARATDATGEVQTIQIADSFPGGATGLPSLQVLVR
ncbi:molybdopterin-dependent oxidoreductase [Fodinicola feengrottensis]|uniref:molybdopterin-dependent oxidoreductase n=1 Tax=Fodinicola feengrottensis TaxID=435914 RepID=UPI0013D69D10|nr:molybdopterin-dependent oxidoreductase [Fodinicola feengrottensis]